MNNSTPRPWSAFKYPDVKTWSVTAKESVASKIKNQADAELIVKAVNRDHLFDRLLTQVQFMYDHYKLAPPHLKDLEDLIAKAKAAK